MLYFDFRFRCRSGCFGLSYLGLLPVRKLPNYPSSLAPFLTSCAYNYIMSLRLWDTQSVVRSRLESTSEGITAEKIRHRKTLRARHLELQNLENAVAAPDQDPAVSRIDMTRIQGEASSLERSGAPYLDGSFDLWMRGTRPYMRRQRPDQIVHFSYAPVPPYY